MRITFLSLHPARADHNPKTKYSEPMSLWLVVEVKRRNGKPQKILFWAFSRHYATLSCFDSELIIICLTFCQDKNIDLTNIPIFSFFQL